MTDLFNTYYDSFGHEIHIGDPVMGETSNYFIYGHIINFEFDKNNNIKYVIKPDIGYKSNKPIILKSKYKINWKRVYLVTIKKKEV